MREHKDGVRWVYQCVPCQFVDWRGKLAWEITTGNPPIRPPFFCPLCGQPMVWYRIGKIELIGNWDGLAQT